MELTLKQIAQLLDGKVVGNENIRVKGIASLTDSTPEDISFLLTPRYLPELKKTQAAAIIVPENISCNEKNLIKVKHPYLAFTKLLELVTQQEKSFHPKCIDPTTIIGKNVTLGENVSLGAYTVIADNVTIGEETVI